MATATQLSLVQQLPTKMPSAASHEFADANLQNTPGKDEEGALVGMITVDDVLTEVLPLAWQKKLRL